MPTLYGDVDLVKRLCDIEDGLTPWEVEFVESIAAQVETRGLPLTDRQREKAAEILERLGG